MWIILMLFHTYGYLKIVSFEQFYINMHCFGFTATRQKGAFQIVCYVIGAHEYFGIKWDAAFIWTNSSRWYIIKKKFRKTKEIKFLILGSYVLSNFRFVAILFLINKEIGREKLLFHQLYLLISLTHNFENSVKNFDFEISFVNINFVSKYLSNKNYITIL